MEVTKFFKERSRMCKTIGNCGKCPLKAVKTKNIIPYWCSDAIMNYPEEAEAIVEKWSKEHPAKTRKQALLEVFPKAVLTEGNDTPIFCVKNFGYKVDNCARTSCKECWGKEV